jgi:hypothetical protein
MMTTSVDRRSRIKIMWHKAAGAIGNEARGVANANPSRFIPHDP